MNNIGEEQENVHLKNGGVFWLQCHTYDIFVIQKKYRVDQVSKEMQISADLLYRMIRGEREWTVRYFCAYLKATKKLDPEKKGDETSLKYLANEFGFDIIPITGKGAYFYAMAETFKDDGLKK